MESKKALYQQEIIELTDLLKTEWHHLRNALIETKVDLEGSYLAGYVEDEGRAEYGVMLTSEKKIIRFVYKDNVMNLTAVNTPEEIAGEFPQIHVR